MGRFSKGVFGAFSGKIGNVVGSSWRDIDYMRTAPKPSSKAATIKQQMQRLSFRTAVLFLSRIRTILELGYGKANTGKATGYNRAVQYTLQKAIKGDYPDYEIDYPKVVLSIGSLYSTMSGRISSDKEEGKVDVSWTCTLNEQDSFDSDKAIVVLYSPAKRLFVTSRTALRRDQKVTIDLTSDFSSDIVHGYIFFVSAEMKRVSDSFYLGETSVF